jgi:hypothetical protein
VAEQVDTKNKLQSHLNRVSYFESVSRGTVSQVVPTCSSLLASMFNFNLATGSTGAAEFTAKKIECKVALTAR